MSQPESTVDCSIDLEDWLQGAIERISSAPDIDVQVNLEIDRYWNERKEAPVGLDLNIFNVFWISPW